MWRKLAERTPGVLVMWTKLQHAAFVGFAFTMLFQMAIRGICLFTDCENFTAVWASPAITFIASACFYMLVMRKRKVEDGILWHSKHKVRVGSIEITLWAFVLIASGFVLGVLWWFTAS